MSCPTGCESAADYCGSLVDFNYGVIEGRQAQSYDYMFMVNGTVPGSPGTSTLNVELFDGKLQTNANGSPYLDNCGEGTKKFYKVASDARVFYRFKCTGYSSSSPQSVTLAYVASDGTETPISTLQIPQNRAPSQVAGAVNLIFHFYNQSRVDVYAPNSYERLGTFTLPAKYVVGFGRADKDACNNGQGICAIRISNANNPCVCSFYGGSFSALKEAAQTDTSSWWSRMSFWQKTGFVIMLFFIIILVAILAVICIGLYKCASKSS